MGATARVPPHQAGLNGTRRSRKDRKDTGRLPCGRRASESQLDARKLAIRAARPPARAIRCHKRAHLARFLLAPGEVATLAIDKLQLRPGGAYQSAASASRARYCKFIMTRAAHFKRNAHLGRRRKSFGVRLVPASCQLRIAPTQIATRRNSNGAGIRGLALRKRRTICVGRDADRKPAWLAANPLRRASSAAESNNNWQS